MTRKKIEQLEGRLCIRLDEYNLLSYCHVEKQHLRQDIDLLIKAIEVLKIEISNPVITRIIERNESEIKDRKTV